VVVVLLLLVTVRCRLARRRSGVNAVSGAVRRVCEERRGGALSTVSTSGGGRRIGRGAPPSGTVSSSGASRSAAILFGLPVDSLHAAAAGTRPPRRPTVHGCRMPCDHGLSAFHAVARPPGVAVQPAHPGAPLNSLGLVPARKLLRDTCGRSSNRR